ncbi:MAG: HNH endonuclease family protein [Antricoccus sp.]
MQHYWWLLRRGWNWLDRGSGHSAARSSPTSVLSSTAAKSTTKDGVPASAATDGGVDPLSNVDGSLPGLAAVPQDQRSAATALIKSVTTAGRGPKTGYDRSCGPGHGCVFGPAWTDDTEDLLGHNGCDTRNDILRRDGTDIATRPGSTCLVISALIADPYTGTTLMFTKSAASRVQINHVIPLSYAYQLGAAFWTAQQRVMFANDPLNLLAVDGSTNAQKRRFGARMSLESPK